MIGSPSFVMVLRSSPKSLENLVMHWFLFGFDFFPTHLCSSLDRVQVALGFGWSRSQITALVGAKWESGELSYKYPVLRSA